MAKKTVLKKALKYAPIKTEFVMATFVDEKVSRIANDDDLTDIEVDYVEYDYNIDPETGEVIDEIQGK